MGNRLGCRCFRLGVGWCGLAGAMVREPVASSPPSWRAAVGDGCGDLLGVGAGVGFYWRVASCGGVEWLVVVGRWVARWGHQLASRRSVAMAGTVRVRTRKVSSRSPQPMMRPAWIMMATEPTMRPNMLAAKMRPAEVMTEPVLATVRSKPTRMLCPDSSGRDRKSGVEGKEV